LGLRRKRRASKRFMSNPGRSAGAKAGTFRYFRLRSVSRAASARRPAPDQDPCIATGCVAFCAHERAGVVLALHSLPPARGLL
jgi:hypothetical protein